jgi:hypothetical protein
MDLPREIVDEATAGVAAIVFGMRWGKEPPANRMPRRHIWLIAPVLEAVDQRRPGGAQCRTAPT